MKFSESCSPPQGEERSCVISAFSDRTEKDEKSKQFTFLIHSSNTSEALISALAFK